jgi:2-amino-4-hydroxy-6-hydroxymethyldihydropteridine diphosphokinase
MAETKKSLLSLGSNLGNPKKNLVAAIKKIDTAEQIKLLQTSLFRKSRPVGGPTGQHEFMNAAVEVETTLTAEQLLETIQRIEAELGRQRHTRWDARTIDIDLLTVDDLVVSSPSLTLPHPRMVLRRFVLEPVCDLRPEGHHPETGWSYQTHLDYLSVAGNYSVTINQSQSKPVPAYLALGQKSEVLVAQSMPVARSTEMLEDSYRALRQWIQHDGFVHCDFAPRECLLNHPEWAGTIDRLEAGLPLPRVLVILTDNIHNELRHQLVLKTMPAGIITPWLFLDAANPKSIQQEIAALATCHL